MNFQNIYIETNRLKLLPISMNYKESIYNEFDDEVTKYMFPKPAENIDETEKFIENSIIKLKNNEEIVFVILNKNNNEFFGCAGIHKIKTLKPEFGIWIKKSVHNNKYGLEAVKGLFNWVINNIDYEYIIYPVDKNNYPSRKIPESLNGKICNEYKSINMKGVEQDILEYRIY